MASSFEFVQYVSEQLCEVGSISYLKMFGEYGIYCDGKLFALVCDNRLFIKKTSAVKDEYPFLEEASPYSGAKPYFLIEEIDNSELLTKISLKTLKELPAPKPGKRKK